MVADVGVAPTVTPPLPIGPPIKIESARCRSHHSMARSAECAGGAAPGKFATSKCNGLHYQNDGAVPRGWNRIGNPPLPMGVGHGRPRHIAVESLAGRWFPETEWTPGKPQVNRTSNPPRPTIEYSPCTGAAIEQDRLEPIIRAKAILGCCISSTCGVKSQVNTCSQRLFTIGSLDRHRVQRRRNSKRRKGWLRLLGQISHADKWICLGGC
jgi:hypothetical protein